MGVKIWRRSVGELLVLWLYLLFLLSGMPMWPGACMKIIAMEVDDHVLRKICMRVRSGCDGVG